jgi:hypothetical protein
LPGSKEKNRWRIPKRVVEGFAKRDLKHLGRIHEICFYKKLRGNLRYAAEFRSTTGLMLKPPKKSDTMFIHTHPERPATASCALPSFNDLKGLLYTSKEHRINTWVISRVDKKGNEIGRTFLRLKISDEKKLRYLLKRMEHFEKGLRYLTPEEREERLEEEARKFFRKWEIGKKLLVKFVPMPGYKYDKKLGDVVKKGE